MGHDMGLYDIQRHSLSIFSEPENLLILTRTKTDRHGRRHSVAVPLIPPPDGEKFEGGYHVERNPVTGGAKLVPPQGGKFYAPARVRSHRPKII